MSYKQFTKLELETKRLGEHWWIVGDGEFGPYGPYNNKVEADDDRRGVLRTERALARGEIESITKGD